VLISFFSSFFSTVPLGFIGSDLFVKLCYDIA